MPDIVTTCFAAYLTVSLGGIVVMLFAALHAPLVDDDYALPPATPMLEPEVAAAIKRHRESAAHG